MAKKTGIVGSVNWKTEKRIIDNLIPLLCSDFEQDVNNFSTY